MNTIDNLADTLTAIVSINEVDADQFGDFINYTASAPSIARFSPDKAFLLNDMDVVHLEIDLTDQCFVGCSQCSFLHVRTRQQLGMDTLSRILAHLGDSGSTFSVTLSGGGDPIVSPYFSDALKLIHTVTDNILVITSGYTGHGWNRVHVEDFADALLQRTRMVRISFDQTLRRDSEKRATALKNVHYLRDKRDREGWDCDLGLAALIDYRADDFQQEAEDISALANDLGLPLFIRPAFDAVTRPTTHDLHQVIERNETLMAILDPDLEVSFRECLERVLLVGLPWNRKQVCPLAATGREAKIRSDGTIFPCVQLATQEYKMSPEERDAATLTLEDIGRPGLSHPPLEKCIYCRETSLNWRWELLQRGYVITPGYLHRLQHTYQDGRNLLYFW